MTDTTAVEARRALLALLLDRVDRDALLPAERPLLRALVTAEQADAGLPKRRHWRGADGADIATAYMDAQAALARVRTYARTLSAEPHPAHDHVCPDDIRAGLLAALNGPPPGPDAVDDAIDEAINVLADDTIRRAVEGNGTGQMLGLLGTLGDIPVEQCRAEFHGTGLPSGRCRLADGHDGMHRDAMVDPDGLDWIEDVAMYPTD